MALALVVYSEHLRYDFSVQEGGEGYKQESTSVFVLDRHLPQYESSNLDLFEGVSLSHARAEIKGGAIVRIAQSTEDANDSRKKHISKAAAKLKSRSEKGR